jgi:predicted aspartyl protease
MQSLITGLPPEVARRIHPDWQKNEAEYWAHRDELLPQYRDQWIGFANGRVIVSGSSPVEVFHKAQESGEHPFVTCVGHEAEPSRMRRASFSYDTTYSGEPLPVMTLEFRKDIGSPGVVFDRVIVDTGADASALPWSDCERLELDPGDGAPGLMGGVGKTVVATVVFPAWAHLDGTNYPCRLQADFTGRERILGREVLNRLDVLFRGPAREVVLNP